MTRSRFFLGACLAAAFLALFRLAAEDPGRAMDPAEHAGRWTSTESLARDMERLASAEFEGRSEEDGGAWRAAAWIEERFRQIGLQTSFQPFEIVRRELAEGNAMSVEGRALVAGKDFLPLTWSAAGAAEGPATTGGDGRRLDGRIAVETVAAAPGMMRTLDPPLSERALRYQQRGAKGVVFVADEQDPEAGGEAVWPSHLPAHSMRRLAGLTGDLEAWTRRRIATGVQARAPRPAGTLGIPALLVPAAAARTAFGDRIEGAEIKLSVAFRVVRTPGVNVLADLPGTGADERRLLVCAHYDSHGRDPRGRIYPGACDNASGVAVLLAVAEAFARAPSRPARGVVFAAFGGEELGLWGSRGFAAQDVRVPGRILAALNIDMAGRGPVDEMYVVGAAHSPRLAELAEIGLGRAGVRTKATIDFSFPNGSDHWPLHRAGVPAVLVTSSRFPECDQLGDRPELVSIEKMLRVTTGVFAAAWRLADSPENLPRPKDVWVKFPGER
ncbi:MAG: M20/M25/M40 family metallo-hydrolase [Planctomycetes bacterium]|nr:M20/M25/M40 family metallo-hydrolase [Planctomycetota bacterium]